MSVTTKDPPRRIYSATGKLVGSVTSLGVYDNAGDNLAYAHRARDGKVFILMTYCAGSYADCEYGDATRRSDGSWSVFGGSKPGVVKRSSAGAWDAYLGTRRVGHAVGSYGLMGAVALLVLPCWCA